MEKKMKKWAAVCQEPYDTIRTGGGVYLIDFIWTNVERLISTSWSQRKTTRQLTVSPSKKRRPSSEQPWGNALRGMTSTSLIGGSRSWSWDYARATTDSVPTCPGKWSWHHHQPATAVLKTRRPNISCRDAHFCRQQDEICGQRQSSYTPNSMAARSNWRRWLHSSCRLDSQCSGNREEEATSQLLTTWH